MDYVAYKPPISNHNLYDKPYVVVEDNGSYLIYLSETWDTVWYIPEKEHSDFQLFKKIEPIQEVYKDIKCAFKSTPTEELERMNFSHMSLPQYYTYENDKIKLIKENECLNKIGFYVQYEYKKQHPIEW